MSRIGKTPIILPKDVTLTKTGNVVMVKGTKGELSMEMPTGISLKTDNDVVTLDCSGKSGKARSLFGFARAHLSNCVIGVSQGFTKQLELVGVGFRAVVTDGNLVLTVGFSHPVTFAPPAGINFAVNEGKIVVSGNDKQLVGQVAAEIRDVKKPEPYKGKGIRYSGEHIRKKAGKAAKAVGGTGVK